MALAHFDVKPKVVSGKIQTDGYDDSQASTELDVRVFGYDFGENVNDPFGITDPGFNTVGPSGLTGGADFKFNVLGSLQYWDGLGSVSLANVTAGEKLRFFLGSIDQLTATGSSGAQPGFTIQTVNANGSLHKHLNAELRGADNNTIPAGPGAWGTGDGVEAAAGVYVLPIEVYLSSGPILASDPFYLVFNNGLTEEQHDEAIDFVQANLLPEPASLSLLGLGAGFILRRRR